ncbi:SGNH/GDSL hydrolase family protein [Arthrobacter deserti]|uniref:SGNH/GDSL hydrolase family protein n=1 Tax=Arthrobacter deserti TaxID=1742687 RepID=A0ABX1JJJ7_9MICC|nr:SGNH/GDSL hydrolase family protein [Arthrobacter deserti]
MQSGFAQAGAPAGHVVLLGDSIFDNKAYARGGPDVVTQQREELPPGWNATLLAVDGDVASGVIRQLRSLPPEATHLVVSAGGNDALGFAYLLQQPAGSVAEALGILSSAQDQFAAGYASMMEAVCGRGLPAAVCTIYDTPESEPNQKVIKTAAAIFNDCITRAAFSRGVSLIDLRLVCYEVGDYANPIEPSSQGGRKIARAIAALLFPGRGAHRSLVVS